MNRLTLLTSAPLFFATVLTQTPAIHAQGASTPVTAATTAAVTPEKFDQGILFPYSLFDRALLDRVDNNGNVDYMKLKDNEDLARFLRAVATADLSQFPVFQREPSDEELRKNRDAKATPDRSAELVFWINAYNAHFLGAITAAYPINTIDEIKDLHTKTRRVANEDYTFAQLRERIAKLDRRALFALADGTQGGPLLNPKAYRWAELGPLLDHAVITYVNNPENVTVSRTDNKVEVTPFLVSINPYFADGRIAGGAERKKLTGVRAVLSQYTDKRANKSYLTTNDYMLVEKQPNRRLNVKGIDTRPLQ